MSKSVIEYNKRLLVISLSMFIGPLSGVALFFVWLTVPLLSEP